MKRLLLIGAAACAMALSPSLPAAAMPLGSSVLITQSDSHTLLVKGGHGGGRGHGYGRGHGHRAHGWSRGKKVGWRGRGCPPGLRMQGRC